MQGVVTDEDGVPLPSANVFLAKTLAGALTDSKGEFRFTTTKRGVFVLTVTAVGFEKMTQATLVEAGQTLAFTFALRNKTAKTGKVVVAASGYGSESGKGMVLSARDIVTTPGGAADIFQAIKTMPGMTQVSESAELFVRGGDPTETITLLDQASLFNPYTFESGFGGLFSKYMEGLNILGIENMFGYTYSRDYAEKIPTTSFFGRRTVVVGFQVTL